VADLPRFFRDLWSTGYRGPLSIELFNRSYWEEDPLHVAKTALVKTQAIIDRALGG
jgi:sugar phosphate isomerase/epimerase